MSDFSQLLNDIELFIRNEVVPYERDPRNGGHGPDEDLVNELRDKARLALSLIPI